MVVRGQKVRSASQRRFVVVVCRPESFEGRRWDYREQQYVAHTYDAFPARVVRRSDSAETARTAARRHGSVPGGFVVVVDTVTGEEV